MDENIIAVLDACKKSIGYISQSINSQKCNCCNLPVCKEIDTFYKSLIRLCNVIKETNPSEEAELKLRANNFIGKQRINPYDFGAIMAVIGILGDRYSLSSMAKKIFISHSSQDENTIVSFVTQILRLGCGLQTDDIVCTSLESMGVRTGEDIRDYLKTQLKGCEYVFFMISENYNKSGICLNEMGAAWVLDKKTKLFLFPDLTFTDLGWLYEISKGSSLDNENALDHLRDELLAKYSLIKSPKTADWTTQKKTFLSVLKNEYSIQPNIDKLCPIICSISGNKNILSPALDFFESDKKYSLYMSKNTHDITVKFSACNNNWYFSALNIKGWIVSDIIDNSREIRLRKGTEGYIEFLFKNTGSAEVIIRAKDFSNTKQISWK